MQTLGPCSWNQNNQVLTLAITTPWRSRFLGTSAFRWWLTRCTHVYCSTSLPFHTTPRSTPLQKLLLSIKQSDPLVTITCEDKNPSVAWASFGPSMMSRWIQMLMARPHTWEFTEKCMDDVVSHYVNLISTCMPAFLKDTSGPFNLDSLPLMYPTIKRKCFRGSCQVVNFNHCHYPVGMVKSCKKDQHSCLRNIVSFSDVPHAMPFRRIARALRYLIHLVCSFFWDHKHVHNEISYSTEL